MHQLFSRTLPKLLFFVALAGTAQFSHPGLQKTKAVPKLFTTLQVPPLSRIDNHGLIWPLPSGWVTNVQPLARPWAFKLFNGAIFHGKSRESGRFFSVLAADKSVTSHLLGLKPSKTGRTNQAFSYAFAKNQIELVKWASLDKSTALVLTVIGVTPEERQQLLKSFAYAILTTKPTRTQ